MISTYISLELLNLIDVNPKIENIQSPLKSRKKYDHYTKSWVFIS